MRAFRAVPAALLLLLATGCVPSGISAKADAVHHLFYVILWLALPVFAFVEGMLVLSIIRYRRRRGDDTVPPQDEGRDGRVLAAFFAGPLVVIVALLAYGENVAATVDRNDPHPAERLVLTGFQWEWSASYVKEGVTVTGKTLKRRMEMELPVGEPTRITLVSNDVIHEFYVPHLLFMKNAVPGHPNVITVRPTREGLYPGQCAQYCGLWHAQMKFALRVVPRAEFRRWIGRQRAALTAHATCRPTGSAVVLTARRISWDKTCIAAAANRPFRLTIRNEDAGIAHDFAIYRAPLRHRLYRAPRTSGPSTKTYTVPALEPGAYYFQCDVHGPAMAGTLVIR